MGMGRKRKDTFPRCEGGHGAYRFSCTNNIIMALRKRGWVPASAVSPDGDFRSAAYFQQSMITSGASVRRDADTGGEDDIPGTLTIASKEEWNVSLSQRNTRQAWF